MRYLNALIFATVLAATANAAGPVLSDEDRATLDLPLLNGQLDGNARMRAEELGNAENIAALDYIRASDTLDLPHLSLLRTYSYAFHNARNPTVEANAAIEQRIVSAFARTNYASTLIHAVRNIDDAGLWNLFYSDVEALAKWRARRRNQCRIDVVSVQQTPRTGNGTYSGFGLTNAPPKLAQRKTTVVGREAMTNVQWKYVCRGGPADDPATDLDGKTGDAIPLPAGPRAWTIILLERRDLASLGAITQTTLPDVEKRLGPLLADLSLPPPVSWATVEKKSDDAGFPPIDVPIGILQLLKKRRVSPGAQVLSPILAFYEAYGAARYPSGKDTIRLLLDLAILDHSREGNEMVARWLPIVIVNTIPQEREYRLREYLEPLASAFPPDQVDLAQVKKSVLEQLPYNELREPTRLLDEAEADNRSLREPSTASVVRWLGRVDGTTQVAYLLAHGANPNSTGPEPSPLSIAVQRTEPRVKTLLDAGADVNGRDLGKLTPLHHAVSAQSNKQEDRAAIVKLLIARGASVNAASDSSATPLHYASTCSECVRLLLAAGAKATTTDNFGRSPLFGAVLGGDIESVRLLLDAGADPNQSDRTGVSPYMAARNGNDRREKLALLESRGGRMSLEQTAKDVGDKTRALVQVPFMR